MKYTDIDSFQVEVYPSNMSECLILHSFFPEELTSSEETLYDVLS